MRTSRQRRKLRWPAKVGIVVIVMIIFLFLAIYWVGYNLDGGEPWAHFNNNSQAKADVENAISNAKAAFATGHNYADISSNQLDEPLFVATPFIDPNYLSCGKKFNWPVAQIQACYEDGENKKYSWIQVCEQSKTQVDWVISLTSIGQPWYGEKISAGCPTLGSPGSANGKPNQKILWQRHEFPRIGL